MKLSFIESKSPNIDRVKQLLEICATRNSWANRGPLYHMLADVYAAHINLPEGLSVVPAANGGIALEAMARLASFRAGRKLRWAVSAFSFRNLGRGYTHDALVIDCDERGLLDLESLRQIDEARYDGIILTNPFGLFSDFSAFSRFASLKGKILLVDNAGGLHAGAPNLPWQAFSLHHTKPYGLGEGGLAVVPTSDVEAFYQILDYGPDQHKSPHWLQNGKISDISCAFLIDRLESAGTWTHLYENQRERVTDIAGRLGFRVLSPPEGNVPMTSIPLIASRDIEEDEIHATKFLTLAKYYKPLKDLPEVTRLFRKIVNVPCHPDVAQLSDREIEADLRAFVDNKSVLSA